MLPIQSHIHTVRRYDMIDYGRRGCSNLVSIPIGFTNPSKMKGSILEPRNADPEQDEVFAWGAEALTGVSPHPSSCFRLGLPAASGGRRATSPAVGGSAVSCSASASRSACASRGSLAMVGPMPTEPPEGRQNLGKAVSPQTSGAGQGVLLRGGTPRLTDACQ